MPETQNIHRERKRRFPWTLILVTLNLIALNFISLEHFTRWDLTETKMYTLSADTVEILNNLEATLTIKAYISEQLPAGYQEFRKRTIDQLEEIKIAAGDKINLVFLDPSSRPDIEREANGYNIKPRGLQSQRADRQESAIVYMGLAVIHLDDFKSIEFINPATLEYDLVMRILRVIREAPVTVAFHEWIEENLDDLTPEVRAQREAARKKRNRFSINNNLSYVAGYLGQNGQYDVTTVALKRPVPKEVTTLVLTNTHLLDDLAMYFVDQFVMRGGKLIILRSGVRATFGPYVARPDRGRLDEWLAHYGIVINKNLVFDTNCLYINEIPYQPYLRLLQKYYNWQHPITAALNNDMYMLFGSSLELSAPPGGDAVTLLRSSAKSWEQSEVFEIDPMKIVDPGKGNYSHYTLVGMVEGSFPSYYTLKTMSEDLLQEITKAERAQSLQRTIKPANLYNFPVDRGEGGTKRNDRDGSDKDSDSGEEKDVPGGGIQDGEEPALNEGGDEPATGLNHPESIKLQSENTAILVIGCEGFIENPTAPYGASQTTQTAIQNGFLGVLQFTANAVDYLSLGKTFKDIRSREVYLRFIDPSFKKKPGTVFFLKVIGAVGGAAVVVALGLIVLYLRKSSRRKAVEL